VPGRGACGGQYTANTMSMVLEILGLSPTGLNGIPAEHPDKDGAAHRCGEIVMDLIRADRRPKDFVTRRSIESAIACVAATGGSTNAVLHLLAIAHEYGIRSTSTSSARSPTERRSWATWCRAGATRRPTCSMQAACRSSPRAVKGGLIDGSTPNCEGGTIASAAGPAQETASQKVVCRSNRP